MENPKKMDLSSMDITNEHKEKLREIFPHVFNEDKIDFERLKQTLGEEVDAGLERFGLSWPGKAECMKIIQEPSIGTLKPCKEESVDFDTTENLFIEGDNLEVLKLLQKSYYGKIKMIYIDPPYNTGKEFIYPDKYSESLETYLAYTGQVDEEGKKFSTNTEADGRFHSKWINMMYSRLFLARNLLKSDGMIFINIDDHEVNNLKRICNEIFGEENFIAQLPTIMNLKGNNDEFGFAGTHEYTLVYSKNRSLCHPKEFEVTDEDLEDWGEDEFGFYKKGANLKATGQNAPRRLRPNLFFPIFISKDKKYYVTGDDKPLNADDITVWPITGEQEMSWRWEKKKFMTEPHNVIIQEDEAVYSFYKKQRPSLGDLPSKKPKTIFYKPEYSSGNGTEELKQIFNAKVFSNPKPQALLKDFLTIGGGESGDIILDFFAGSAPIAQSILNRNKKEKFICVQLPEKCDEKSEVGKKAIELGMNTIAEIGKERIRRVIEKIRKETRNQLDFDHEQLDLGFKVFKLDQSNFKIWDGTIEENQNTEKIGKQLELQIEHINPKATEEDILYELLLKCGFELTAKIESLQLAGKKVFSIEEGALLICLEKNLTKEVITEMARKEPARVICLDVGFSGNDQLKTNAVQIMKSHKVEDFRTV